eukprot:TRINITY_DN397_c0_g1_i2.p1 TRINITY_DN397_c0_g1~~TRINITY_DN397_c0_g1_i2.p1  ORF type:complete len:303 (-),score=65.83 TRINITY_DN397_c0_g1_i2:61-969(-)
MKGIVFIIVFVLFIHSSLSFGNGQVNGRRNAAANKIDSLNPSDRAMARLGQIFNDKDLSWLKDKKNMDLDDAKDVLLELSPIVVQISLDNGGLQGLDVNNYLLGLFPRISNGMNNKRPSQIFQDGVQTIQMAILDRFPFLQNGHKEYIKDFGSNAPLNPNIKKKLMDIKFVGGGPGYRSRRSPSRGGSNRGGFGQGNPFSRNRGNRYQQQNGYGEDQFDGDFQSGRYGGRGSPQRQQRQQQQDFDGGDYGYQRPSRRQPSFRRQSSSFGRQPSFNRQQQYSEDFDDQGYDSYYWRKSIFLSP